MFCLHICLHWVRVCVEHRVPDLEAGNHSLGGLSCGTPWMPCPDPGPEVGLDLSLPSGGSACPATALTAAGGMGGAQTGRGPGPLSPGGRPSALRPQQDLESHATPRDRQTAFEPPASSRTAASGPRVLGSPPSILSRGEKISDTGLPAPRARRLLKVTWSRLQRILRCRLRQHTASHCQDQPGPGPSRPQTWVLTVWRGRNHFGACPRSSGPDLHVTSRLQEQEGGAGRVSPVLVAPAPCVRDEMQG